MKIAHILPVTGESSGIFSVVKDASLKFERFFEIIVFSEKPNIKNNDLSFGLKTQWRFVRKWTLLLLVDLFLSKKEQNNIYKAVHLHTIWNFRLFIYFCLLSHASDKCIILPHGNLTPVGLNKSRFKKKIYLKILHFFIPRNVMFIALTDVEKEQCIDIFNVSADKILVIPNYLDRQADIEDCNDEEENSNTLKLLYVGRIDKEHKGIDRLLTVTKYLADNKVDFQFRIVGPYRSKKDKIYVENTIESLNLKDYVEVTGEVPRESLANYYRNSDYLFLFSRYEGLPMVILEALSYGLPVIITKATNIGNYIHTYDAGHIVQDLDEGIIQDLKFFIAETKYDRNIKKVNAKKCFNENFTWSVVSKKYKLLYGIKFDE